MAIKHYCDVCGAHLNQENPNRAKGYILEHVFEEEVDTGENDEDGDPIMESKPGALVQAKIIFAVDTGAHGRLVWNDGDLCMNCCNEVLTNGLVKE